MNGTTEKLDRYLIEGLIWGRETLWLDSKRNLIAAVTLDAEFDHFEAIRDALAQINLSIDAEGAHQLSGRRVQLADAGRDVGLHGIQPPRRLGEAASARGFEKYQQIRK